MNKSSTVLFFKRKSFLKSIQKWEGKFFPVLLLNLFVILSCLEVKGADISVIKPSGEELPAMGMDLGTQMTVIPVYGTVSDAETGEALAGVSIRVQGANAGTVTDAEGHFSLEAEEDAVLVISFIGYTTQEVSVNGRNSISVSLAASSTGLEQLVVVGYGVQKKKDLTGSIASIKSEDFNDGVNVNPEQLIQGKISGVRIINNSGQPGGSTTISIRGNSSIRAGNTPLFVLDGVPLSGNSVQPGGNSDFGTDPGNPLDYLNPDDIESIDVLKDASATAIYGSRGANGVVIINTKKGSSGEPTLSVNSSIGFSKLLRRPEVLSSKQFRQALETYTPDEASQGDFGDNVNAFNEILRSAVMQNHSVAVSGGGERGHYRMSLGYLNQDGIIKGSNLTKYTASLNSSYKFLENEALGLDVDMFYTHSNERIAPINTTAGASGNVISQALNWNPTLPLKDNQGDLTFVNPNIINPLASLQAFSDHSSVNTFIAIVSPSYRFTDWLQYKLTYSLTDRSGLRRGMYDRLLIDPGSNTKGEGFIGNDRNLDQQLTQTLNFDKDLTDGIHLTAVAGYEFLSFDTKSSFESGTGFENQGLDFSNYLQFSPTSSRNISSDRSPKNNLKSEFLRTNFNFFDRYLLTATIRRDGSTKFGENNRIAYFPSVAVAWNISNETFFNASWVDNLKLRLGYGQTGNSEFPSGASRNRYVFSSQSIHQTNYGNPDLKWETSVTYNVGLDFALLKGRLQGTVEGFYKSSKDALFERFIAQPAPSGKIWVNLDGRIINKGIEVELAGDIIRGDKWKWNASVNATFLKNNVKSLQGFYETAELRGQGFTGVVGQRMIGGHPLNTWYLAIFDGIDPSDGLSMYRSIDDGHSGTDVDPAQNKFYVHSANPKQLLGISTTVFYKKLSATFNMHGAFGHYLFNNTVATGLALSNLPSRNIANMYFKPELNESLSNSAAPSTRYLEKGNFMKMANAQINYRIGDIGGVIKDANIYFTGQNIFVLTKYKGFDPEVNTDGSRDGIPSLGIEYIPYPSARSFLFGIKFSL